MDVVMARARMAGVGPQDALELGHDLRGPGIRLPRLLVPVVPGTLIHQRLGVQRRRVQVVGVPLDDLDAATLYAEALMDKRDRKSTRLNSSHGYISYAVFCLKKKKKTHAV